MEAYERWEAAVRHNMAQPLRSVPSEVWRRIMASPALEEEDVRRAATACHFFHALLRADPPGRRPPSARERAMVDAVVPASGALLMGLFARAEAWCVFCQEAGEGDMACGHAACARCFFGLPSALLEDHDSQPDFYAAWLERRCPACRRPVELARRRFEKDGEPPRFDDGHYAFRRFRDVAPIAGEGVEAWVDHRDRMRRLAARALSDPSKVARAAIRGRICAMWGLAREACERAGARLPSPDASLRSWWDE